MTRVSADSHSILQSLPYAVLALDSQLRFKWLNTAALWILNLDGTPDQDALLSDFLPQEIADAICEAAHESLEFGVERLITARLNPKAGALVSITTNPWRALDGELLGVIVCAQMNSAENDGDDDERKSELQQTFLSVISHELKTPLTSIMGAVNLLCHHQEESVSSEHAHLLKIVQTNSARLARTVEDIIDAVQIARGTLTLVRNPTDLADLTQSVLDDLNNFREARHVQLVSDLSPIRADVDIAHTRRVIYHLLENGIKFNREGGTLQVRVGADENHAHVTVSDEGPGIPPDEQQRAFHAFTQSEDYMTRRAGGTGSGLYLCRCIAELHGGSLALSTTSSRGSTFVLSLPLGK